MKKILWMLVVSLVLLTSCGKQWSPVDIINPDAEYLYFYGATCPHCQELNRIADSKDLYTKISIEKKEVYRNRENADDFRKLIEKIGWDFNKVWVPFVYDTVTGKFATGVKPALKLMTARLGQTAEKQVKSWPKNNTDTKEEAQDTNITKNISDYHTTTTP